MKENRILKKTVNIDAQSVQQLYGRRAQEKKNMDVDAPVVLAGDKDPEKISLWTNYEIERRLPLAKINAESRVLELGFGTGRISKYITSKAAAYVGIDYVEEFVELARRREDIHKTAQTWFLSGSLQELAEKRLPLPTTQKFNRFLISGGVFMYINDEELKRDLEKLPDFFAEHCVMYISEPIAMKERLTLDKFYSADIKEEYSAIYRTEEEYKTLFAPFFAAGFELKISEEFFHEDIKGQKETRQWIFVLER